MYITDLDNTLLNGNGLLSDFTKEKLQQLINHGVPITFATARSGFTSGVVLNFIDFKLPFIILNGGAIIDPFTGELLYVSEIRNEIFIEVIKSTIGLTQPFVIGVNNGKEVFLHKKVTSEVHKNHLNNRLIYGDKRQVEVDEFHQIDNVINVTFLDTFDNISEVEAILRSKFSEELTIYKYVKTKKDDTYYFLDVSSKGANKGNAIRELSKITGFSINEMTCFGDEVNDIEMFNENVTGVAVANAIKELKHSAKLVIGPNTEDSVIKYIINNEDKVKIRRIK